MPGLSFLKKIRTRELPGHHSKDENSSPASNSSATTTPATPSSPLFDTHRTQPSISTQSTSWSSASSIPAELLHSDDSQKQPGSVAGVQLPMTQGVTQQHQLYAAAASPHNLGTPAHSNHHLPGISSIIHPSQHDGAAQSRQQGEPPQQQQQQQQRQQQQQQQQITPNKDASNANADAMASIQASVPHGAEAQSTVKPTKGKYTLNDFDMRRTLGTGSFGRVHLVQSKHNQRFYAVKVLKKAQVVKMKQVEHTNDERKMLNEVKHPFLITLWGTFQDSKNLYMVMDFVEGGELFSLLRKSQRFPNPVAKFYAAEVTLAIEYLHKKDIIYRDLKPENLLLDRHGHIKITDFGFAKRVPDITWTLCGTPDYLAPEVVSSKGYNKSVDWWSLGILIFEMLCGFTPFWDGGSPMKIYENILKGRVKYPAYIHTDAQDLLQRLITQDLTKRLGNLVNGSADVKNHPWFAEVTWERLFKKDIDAPYVPPVKGGVGDASQFDKYPEEAEAYGVMGHDEHGKLFTDF